MVCTYKSLHENECYIFNSLIFRLHIVYRIPNLTTAHTCSNGAWYVEHFGSYFTAVLSKSLPNLCQWFDLREPGATDVRLSTNVHSVQSLLKRKYPAQESWIALVLLVVLNYIDFLQFSSFDLESILDCNVILQFSVDQWLNFCFTELDWSQS